MLRIFEKKLVVITMMLVNGYHEMKHNSTVTCQNRLKIWNQKAKQIFSKHSKNVGPQANIFDPRPLFQNHQKRPGADNP